MARQSIQLDNTQDVQAQEYASLIAFIALGDLEMTKWMLLLTFNLDRKELGEHFILQASLVAMVKGHRDIEKYLENLA